MRAYPLYLLRGQVGGGWALEFESFLGPVKWDPADRRVPFVVHNTFYEIWDIPRAIQSRWILYIIVIQLTRARQTKVFCHTIQESTLSLIPFLKSMVQ